MAQQKNYSAAAEEILGRARQMVVLSQQVMGVFGEMGVEMEKIAEIALLLQSPSAAVIAFINDKGVQVSDITVKDTDAPLSATVLFLDAKGAPTHPDDIPVWTSQTPEVATVEASADGLLATVTPGMPGATQIKVTSFDTDQTIIEAAGTVTVTPGEAVIGSVEFTPPSA